MLATLRILRATTFLRLYKVFFIIIIRCADCVRELECQRKHCPSTADKNPPLSQKSSLLSALATLRAPFAATFLRVFKVFFIIIFPHRSPSVTASLKGEA